MSERKGVVELAEEVSRGVSLLLSERTAMREELEQLRDLVLTREKESVCMMCEGKREGMEQAERTKRLERMLCVR